MHDRTHVAELREMHIHRFLDTYARSKISCEPDTAVDVPVLTFACLNVDATFGDRLESTEGRQD